MLAEGGLLDTQESCSTTCVRDTMPHAMRVSWQVDTEAGP